MTGRWLLPDALGLKPVGDLVSFVGGGGKTSLLFATAREIDGRVLMTTTTRLFSHQPIEAKENLGAIVLTNPTSDEVNIAFQDCEKVLVIGGQQGEKVQGVPLEAPQQWLALPSVDYVLVEADGSRQRPIKAPASHEPALPLGTKLLAPVAGIDACGKAISAIAHRPELVTALLGKSPDDILTAADVATLLAHRKGGAKLLAAGVRFVPVINKVETGQDLVTGRKVAQALLRQAHVERVLLTAAGTDHTVREVHRRVTAVVLAAGSSRRMGRTKQLLPWKESTILGQTLQNALGSEATDQLLVSGHDAKNVEAVARTMGVPVIRNPEYASGEMLSSLQTAVAALPGLTEAVIVLLADQPDVGPEIINTILEAYWQGAGQLIAPTFKGRRGNPVLIGRCHFAELLALPNGSAPRDLLARHKVHLIDVGSTTVLQDIDRPEDYERLRP